MLDVSTEEISVRLAEDNLWWTERGGHRVRFEGLKKRYYLEPY